jgi:hypothetical protein
MEIDHDRAQSIPTSGSLSDSGGKVALMGRKSLVGLHLSIFCLFMIFALAKGSGAGVE